MMAMRECRMKEAPTYFEWAWSNAERREHTSPPTLSTMIGEFIGDALVCLEQNYQLIHKARSYRL